MSAAAALSVGTGLADAAASADSAANPVYDHAAPFVICVYLAASSF